MVPFMRKEECVREREREKAREREEQKRCKERLSQPFFNQSDRHTFSPLPISSSECAE